jgi:hypothetical protein
MPLKNGVIIEEFDNEDSKFESSRQGNYFVTKEDLMSKVSLSKLSMSKISGKVSGKVSDKASGKASGKVSVNESESHTSIRKTVSELIKSERNPPRHSTSNEYLQALAINSNSQRIVPNKAPADGFDPFAKRAIIVPAKDYEKLDFAKFRSKSMDIQAILKSKFRSVDQPPDRY